MIGGREEEGVAVFPCLFGVDCCLCISSISETPFGLRGGELFLLLPLLHCFSEKEMAPHSSVLAWRVPGTGEPGGLPSMGSHRVGHD